jgi:hypothetical protein
VSLYESYELVIRLRFALLRGTTSTLRLRLVR